MDQAERNRIYNQERKAMDELIKRDWDRDMMIEKMYTDHANRIQSQIDKLWLNYADAKGVSVGEMKKQANKMDVQAFADKAATAVKEKDFSKETNDWLKTYNAKMRISRLELMKAEIQFELESLKKSQSNLFDTERQSELVRELKRQSGIMGLSNPTVNIKKILDADFYGKGFSERVWQHNESIKKVTFKLLNQIYVDMEGFKKQRGELMKQFGVSRNEAQRLLKTEIARINSDARYEVYILNNFTHFENITEPGACKFCTSKAGYLIPIEERELGVTCAPFHPNCRCSDYGVVRMERKEDSKNHDEQFNKGFNTTDDPIREVMGSMFDSHSSEAREIIAELEDIGVPIVFNDSGGMNYQPSPILGQPGKISIDKRASHSALIHEYTHAIDDYQDGWNGMKVLFDKEKRAEREMRAYDAELEFYLLNNVDEEYIIRLEKLRKSELDAIYGE